MAAEKRPSGFDADDFFRSPDADEHVWEGVEPGVRIYSDGMKPGQRQDFFSECYAVLTLWLVCSWMMFAPILIILGLFYPLIFKIDLLILATLLIPAEDKFQWASNWYMFKTWRRYFNYSMTVDETVKSNGTYMLGMHPHGAYPMGQILMWTNCPDYKRGINAMVHTNMFRVPFYKQLWGWMGSVPITREKILECMRKPNRIVAVMVGGMVEMFHQHMDREEIYVKKRKTIFRLCLQTGTHVVPIYLFGNTRLLTFGPRWMERLSRSIRAGIGLPYGRWGLIIPRKVPLYAVSGKLVYVKEPMDPKDPRFEEAVEEFHRRFVKQLKDTYDLHKAEYGWQDIPLVCC